MEKKKIPPGDGPERPLGASRHQMVSLVVNTASRLFHAVQEFRGCNLHESQRCYHSVNCGGNKDGKVMLKQAFFFLLQFSIQRWPKVSGPWTKKHHTVLRECRSSHSTTAGINKPLSQLLCSYWKAVLKTVAGFHNLPGSVPPNQCDNRLVPKTLCAGQSSSSTPSHHGETRSLCASLRLLELCHVIVAFMSDSEWQFLLLKGSKSLHIVFQFNAFHLPRCPPTITYNATIPLTQRRRFGTAIVLAVNRIASWRQPQVEKRLQISNNLALKGSLELKKRKRWH